MLIPLTMPLMLAVSCFETELSVVDTKYEKQGSQDVQIVVARRKIKGAVDKQGARKLENIFGGSVTDGAIAIHTSDCLYIGDTYNAGDEQLQSFFWYNGFNYRVAGVDPWKEQTGINLYLGVRHQTQEII